MPKAPRGKRVVDAETGTVVNKAPNVEAEPDQRQGPGTPRPELVAVTPEQATNDADLDV